jgi:hypothetical protein
VISAAWPPGLWFGEEFGCCSKLRSPPQTPPHRKEVDVYPPVRVSTKQMNNKTLGLASGPAPPEERQRRAGSPPPARSWLIRVAPRTARSWQNRRLRRWSNIDLEALNASDRPLGSRQEKTRAPRAPATHPVNPCRELWSSHGMKHFAGLHLYMFLEPTANQGQSRTHIKLCQIRMRYLLAVGRTYLTCLPKACPDTNSLPHES